MDVRDIENAILHLSAADFDRIAASIDKRRAEMWDRQIEADALAGRLDRIGLRADDQFDAGLCDEI